MSQNRSSRNCHSLKKHRKRINSWVCNFDFLYFHCIVAEEIIESVGFLSSIVWSVIPDYCEWENFSVVSQISIKLFIWFSTFKFDFKIFFGFSEIWRNLFHIKHHSWVQKVVVKWSFRGVQRNLIIFKELSCEVVTVIQTINSWVNVDLDSNVKIGPMISCCWTWLWNFVSFQEDTLWNATVFNSRLANVHWVIFQMIINDTLSNSVVFVLVFNYWFLEISEES